MIFGDSSKKSIPIIITNRTLDLLTGNTTDAGARVNALNFDRAPIAKSVPLASAYGKAGINSEKPVLLISSTTAAEITTEEAEIRITA